LPRRRHKDIARVHVSMKKTVTKSLRKKDPHTVMGKTPHINAGLFQ